MYAGDDVRRQQRKDKRYTYYPSVQTAIIQVNCVVLRYSKMPKKKPIPVPTIAQSICLIAFC
jgi:hypothetical protein